MYTHQIFNFPIDITSPIDFGFYIHIFQNVLKLTIIYSWNIYLASILVNWKLLDLYPFFPNLSFQSLCVQNRSSDKYTDETLKKANKQRVVSPTMMTLYYSNVSIPPAWRAELIYNIREQKRERPARETRCTDSISRHRLRIMRKLFQGREMLIASEESPHGRSRLNFADVISSTLLYSSLSLSLRRESRANNVCACGCDKFVC